MKALARRGFLRLAGAVGLGAGQLPAAAVASAKGTGFGIGSGPQAQPSTHDETPPWVRSKLSERLWRTLRGQNERLEQDFYARQAFKVAGLDPDLYQRVSGSHAWRAAVQRKRDLAARKPIKEIYNRLWPRIW